MLEEIIAVLNDIPARTRVKSRPKRNCLRKAFSTRSVWLNFWFGWSSLERRWMWQN